MNTVLILLRVFFNVFVTVPAQLALRVGFTATLTTTEAGSNSLHSVMMVVRPWQ